MSIHYFWRSSSFFANLYFSAHNDFVKSPIIPIKREDNVVAVMNVEFPQYDAFDDEDLEALKTLAEQAGTAISNAERAKIFERWTTYQQAVYQASREIVKGVPSNRQELLDRILEQVTTHFKPEKGNVTLGVIQYYNKAAGTLCRESVYPSHWKSYVGKKRLIASERGANEIGINGRTALIGEAQCVHNVNLDEDYVEICETTCSELDVPIFSETGEVWGVLGVESDEFAAFDEADVLALKQFAQLASIAIQYVQKLQELGKKNKTLEDTEGLLAARTAIAWVAARHHDWRKSLLSELGLVQTDIKSLYEYVPGIGTREEFRQHIAEIEQSIDGIWNRTREKKFSSIDDVQSVPVGGLIENWFMRLRIPEEISYDLSLDCTNCLISVNPDWLKLALDNLAYNAIEAMNESTNREFAVAAIRENDTVGISICDTGPGIPEDVVERLFCEVIDGTNGSGVGALVSAMIVERYGGNISIGSSNPSRTSIVVRLPVEPILSS